MFGIRKKPIALSRSVCMSGSAGSVSAIISTNPWLMATSHVTRWAYFKMIQHFLHGMKAHPMATSPSKTPSMCFIPSNLLVNITCICCSNRFLRLVHLTCNMYIGLPSSRMCHIHSSPRLGLCSFPRLLLCLFSDLFVGLDTSSPRLYPSEAAEAQQEDSNSFHGNSSSSSAQINTLFTGT